LRCSFVVEPRKNNPVVSPSAAVTAQIIHLEYFMVLFTVTGVAAPTSLPARQDTPSARGGQLPVVFQCGRLAGLFQLPLLFQEILVAREFLQGMEKKIFCLRGTRI